MAGRIPQDFIDQLLNRIDIVDLIDGYVPLKKAGANYKACCPFHGEKTPSFTVSPSKQFYHCFGCGANGTAISFLMEYDHMEFREAIEKLASSAGMEIPQESQHSGAPRKTVSRGVDLYELMNQVSDFYQTQLRQHADRQQAVDYLKQRGLSGEIAKRFHLGFAPQGWDNVMSELGATQAMQKALLDTGVLTQNEKNKIYDRFRDRIVFPIHDHRGRVVGFGGRVIGPGEPKYLNSPETPIFHKGSELYGLFAARGAIKQTDYVLVVEGYMDVVALAQAGIDNAVATLGTATTAMHLQRLFRHTPNLVFSFDGDRAGRAAAWKALETCLPSLQDGYQISFLFLPDGEDPDTMVKKTGKQGFEQLIKEATPLPEFLIESLTNQVDMTRLDGRARLSNLAQPLINKLPDGMLKKLVIERLALLTQLNAQDLLGTQTSTAPSSGQRQPSRSPLKKRNNRAVTMTPVRRAVSLILQYPHLHNEFEVLKSIPEDQLRGVGMVKSLMQACEQNPNVNTAMLLERYRHESYIATLLELANHQHNNIEVLEEGEAVDLIRATVSKIIDEYNALELTKAERELDVLDKRAQVSNLNKNEQARRSALAAYIRESYK